MTTVDIRGDRMPDYMPVSLLFSRVLDAKDNSTIERLANIYAHQVPLTEDHDVMGVLHNRLDNITDEMSKQNWALFCLHVLFKHECNLEGNWEKNIDLFIPKFKAMPDFEIGIDQLHQLKKEKISKFRLKEYVKWALSDEICLEPAVRAHGWYFDSGLFIKALTREAQEDKSKVGLVADAFILLSRIDPLLFANPTHHKLAYSVGRLAELSKGKTLMSSLNQPQPSASTGLAAALAATPNISFEHTLARYRMNEEVKSELKLLAHDLYTHGALLFKKCYLSDFIHQGADKDLAKGITHFSDFYNKIGLLVKNEMAACKNMKDRTHTFAFFIELACNSYKASDHLSTMALILAIESEALQDAYKEAWKKYRIS